MQIYYCTCIFLKINGENIVVLNFSCTILFLFRCGLRKCTETWTCWFECKITLTVKSPRIARPNLFCYVTNMYNLVVFVCVGICGLSPGDPRFVGSNPAEVVRFFQDVHILSTSPPGGTLTWGSWVWDFGLVKYP